MRQKVAAMANFTPLGPNRRVPGAENSGIPPPNVAAPAKYVDSMGQPVTQPAVSGACHKCGFTGHLPYQCRNTLPVEVDGQKKTVMDVSSTSSDSSDDDTPLKKADRKLRKANVKKLQKELKKLQKKNKKRKKRRHSTSSSSSDTEKKSKKDKKKSKKSKKSKKRKRESSSSSTDD